MVTRTRRLLLLSFYYPPDLAAGSFRTAALVEALLERLPPNVEVDVITTLPNRYGSFRPQAATQEEHGRLRVRRLAIPSHQSGIPDQGRGFNSFARQAARATAGDSYDLVFATSSRLMTASLGAWLARRKRVPLYLDIRDIFVDTVKHLLPATASRTATYFFRAVENWTIRSAAHVNLVSPGFAPYFNKRYPSRSFSYFTNGIDDDFVARYSFSAGRTAAPRSGRTRVLYAGNIGEGQGLHGIVPVLSRQLEHTVEFRIVGAGGRRTQLEQALARSCVDNVVVLDPVPRHALIDEYRSADVLFLHLNAYDAFEKVLPSKVFEYAATGKPIWAGVRGYPQTFIESNIDNAATFAPCNENEALAALRSLQLVTSPRHEFIEEYSRRRIMHAMADHIAGVLDGVHAGR